MANVVTASIVVDFDAGEGEGILLAEVDAFPSGLNQGNTTFAPGESPGFLVYRSSNVVIDSITSSHGSISSLGGGTTPDPIIDDLIYTDDKKAQVQYPIYSGFSAKALGSNFDPGTISHDEVSVSIENQVVSVIRATYTSYFSKYRLTGIPDSLNGETSFPVVILVTGHIV